MKTNEQFFCELLKTPNTQFVIPVYQRVYAWGSKQCDALWNDIVRSGSRNAPHFIGTVLVADESSSCADARCIDIIDGQQRTATITLILAALRDYLAERDLSIGNVDADFIDEAFLFTRSEDPYKLHLSSLDQTTLRAVLDRSDLPEEDDLSENVVANYRQFRQKMEAGFDAATFWRGLNQLLVIVADLDEDDRPQAVFESLNSKGMPLTTADLARNLLFIGIDYDEQSRLYEQYWEPVEKLYENDGDAVSLNAALRGWLAIKAPHLHISDKDDVYAAFKGYLQNEYRGSIEDLLRGLSGFLRTFAARTQAATSSAARDAHMSWGTGGHTKGLNVDRRLFGD